MLYQHLKDFVEVKEGYDTSGVATGVARGAECHLWQRKFAKNWENQEKIRKNREEKAKFRKFLSLCPSWQIGLATPLYDTHGIWCIAASHTVKQLNLGSAEL